MRHRHRGPVLARPSLLFATLCYIAVATLGPWQHLTIELASLTANSPVSQVASRADDASDAPTTPTRVPRHDPRSCLLCHSFESVAVPATGAFMPTATIRPAPAPHEIARVAVEGARPNARARAPPLFV